MHDIRWLCLPGGGVRGVVGQRPGVIDVWGMVGDTLDGRREKSN